MAIPVVEFSRQRYKIGKVFAKKSTVFKWNYWILRIGLRGSLSSLQKSEFLKLIISLLHYFWCQNQNEWQKMSGKNTHIWFFIFGSKMNEFERKKSEKKQKNYKILKVAITLTSISHYLFNFLTWKTNQFSKSNNFIWLQLIFMEKPFQFCIPALKTPQPVMP
jgi:hypothetical protein